MTRAQSKRFFVGQTSSLHECPPTYYALADWKSALQKASAFCLVLFVIIVAPLARAANSPPVIEVGKNDELVYRADEQGNRVPDFSHAGYKGGGVPLPNAPVRLVLAPPAPGVDATELIQNALDRIALLKPDENGIRGALLLRKGRYEISGQIHIRESGVVLRGEGSDTHGTVLVATGWERRPLILVSNLIIVPSSMDFLPHEIQGDCIPVGATQVQIAHDAKAVPFKIGDRVEIKRPSTKEWIEALGMHDAPGRQNYEWPVGSADIRWHRVVTKVETSGNVVTIAFDAPLTTALEKKYGGGTIAEYAPWREINDVGVEYLRCESTFDAANPLDEQHSWVAVALDDVRDAWVRDVQAVHFASSAVDVGAGASRVTVQDCASIAPVSEYGGYRRYAFLTSGQQTLFLRCKSEDAMRDFATGYLAAGPNAFVECVGSNSHGNSGSIGSWASGSLFDCVDIDGGGIELTNLETWNQGVGWASANSMMWQCSAGVITCRKPPGAQNWASGPWAQFVGGGHWDRVNEYVKPVSLYRGQLEARLGKTALDALQSNPPPSAVISEKNLATVPQLPPRDPTIPDVRSHTIFPVMPRPLQLKNGWLIASDELLYGTQRGIRYWRNTLSPSRVEDENGSSIGRFAPGRYGPGLTDDIDQLTTDMAIKGQVILRHHYGLWYERRRDDHERVRRPDSDVWPPFFEQAFARSGQGRAWDGLSKYDLTKYNPYYFGRIRQFAEFAREKGLVLYYETFFQHNILEAGAHWVDTPWRPANALQDLGFPEPVPFTEGGKRIHMADTFYDVSHPLRREIYRAYIRQCLSNTAGEPNVIYSLTNENTGPLHFMQFWLDVVEEWMRETGKRPLIALSATKDVQDAILADARRAAIISVIDLKYWWYTDKTLYAPEGGKNLSPRQHERLWKGGRPSAAAVARMIREYREKFPDKAILCHAFDDDEWLNLAAGASLPQLQLGQGYSPANTPLFNAIAQMRPLAGESSHTQYTLADAGKNYFAVSLGAAVLEFDLTDVSSATRFTVYRIDAATGKATATGDSVQGGKRHTFSSQDGKNIIWLSSINNTQPKQ